MDITANESPETENEPPEKEKEAEPDDQKISGQGKVVEKPKKSAQDARARRKDEKTISQVLKTLDNLKTPEEKLVAMCTKYSELLHENRQLQSTVKQSEKTVNMIHREKEQFRNERSKAILAKTRMEQLCRELQKLNKAQQEETALKLKVEEEKRKEICSTFQGAFAEMNTLTNQSNEKSAKLQEENLEMREKIQSFGARIELTEKQLDMVRQEAKLELQLAREKCITEIEKLKAEKLVLKADKRHLIWKLAQEKVERKEQDIKEEHLKKQLELFRVKSGEYALGLEEVNKLWHESLVNTRTEHAESMKTFQKELAVWQERWDKVTIEFKKMMMINEQRDAEILTMYKKLATLQDLCKTFQRERSSLIAQLREKNDNITIDSSIDSGEAMKQVEEISKDCENIKANLVKSGRSMFEAQKRSIRARNKEYTTPQEVTRKLGGKVKKGRNKSAPAAPAKQEIEKDTSALAEGFAKFQQHKKLFKEMESLFSSRTDPLGGQQLEGTKDSTIDEMLPENECLEKASLDIEFPENESRENKLLDKKSLENEYPEKEWLENEYSEEESLENECPQKETLQNECLQKESLENDCPEKESLENEYSEKTFLENECPEKESVAISNLAQLLEKESVQNDCPEKELLENEYSEKTFLENECPQKESLENECPQKESLKNECPEKESAVVSDSAQLLATLLEKMENGTVIEDSCIPINTLEKPSGLEHENKIGQSDA